jgi:methionine synthase I (cobalamin-dependent)
MNFLFTELLASGPVLTDGAWGTQMLARGLAAGGCPDAWNLERPDCVEDVARAYVAAGSQVILTNTFGANRFALSRYVFADKVVEINRLGVEISRRAASSGVKVFASIGPSGQMLTTEEVTVDELYEAFTEQANALLEGGADAIVVETMSDLLEAQTAVRAAKQTGLPVVASMSYGAGRAGDRTVMGITPERAVEGLTEAGADAIGTNCGVGAEAILPVVERLRAATSLPVWVKPNAGQPELINEHVVYRTTPEEFATAAKRLVEAGANFIGGCCGTSPEYIAALRALL